MKDSFLQLPHIPQPQLLCFGSLQIKGKPRSGGKKKKEKIKGKKNKEKKKREKKPEKKITPSNLKPKTLVKPPFLLPTIQVRAPAWKPLAVCQWLLHFPDPPAAPFSLSEAGTPAHPSSWDRNIGRWQLPSFVRCGVSLPDQQHHNPLSCSNNFPQDTWRCWGT